MIEVELDVLADPNGERELAASSLTTHNDAAGREA